MAGGFVDEARINVRAGDGGHGAVSFHRTKHKPRGGPDGGNGGHGGSVVLVADASIGTLTTYARGGKYRAPSGGKGEGNNRTGADADDLELAVPVGTMVHNATTRELLADLAKPGVRFLVARGGRGGRGNASMRSSADRVPGYAERGEPGEELTIRLELRLVADVGLLGPPNAGKSTLLAAISAATPKIADYPFTTIDPGLGVVEVGETRFVAADLPGLIEGASEGKGMGTRFLQHATRCRVLAAVVELSGPDPVADLDTLGAEVRAYDESLLDRLTFVVGNKIDLKDADTEAARAWAVARDMEFVAISAKAGANLEELTRALASRVAASRESQPEQESFAVLRPVAADRVLVTKEGEGYRVRSERVERLVTQTAVDNRQAVRRLQRRLRAMGVESALDREGAKEGDEIYIGDRTFEYMPDA